MLGFIDLLYIYIGSQIKVMRVNQDGAIICELSSSMTHPIKTHFLLIANKYLAVLLLLRSVTPAVAILKTHTKSH